MKLKNTESCLDPSVVLYLPLHRLDGEAFASKDNSGCRCTATGCLWTPQGRIFNGTSGVITTEYKQSLDLVFGWTFICWFKSTETNNYRSLAAKGPANDINFYRPTTNVLRCHTYDGTGWTVMDTAANDWFNGEWHQYAAVCPPDGTNAKAYRNGEQTAITGGNLSVRVPRTGSDKIWYVAQYGSGLQYLNGTIGEVLIYNRALPPHEIQHIYLQTKGRYF